MPPLPATLSVQRVAVGVAGFCAFINLYGPQAILPLLAVQFGASPAEISHTMTACTLAVALTAPFTGALADVLGRKRVIVSSLLLLALPSAMLAFAPTLEALIFWRFVQGLLLPPVFAVTVAYIGDEWPPEEAAGVTGIYTSGSSLGGFGGRLAVGVIADLIGWRYGFGFLATATLLGGVALYLWLPREKRFVRSEGLAASAWQMLQHLRSRRLLAVYAVGFGVLFNFIATFTYINFHLAAPPYALSATALGALFTVYLTGSVLTPWLGWANRRFGRRRFMLGVIVAWIAGIVLTLAPSLVIIILGLAISAGAGMLAQAISTNYVAATATAGRSSAVGLYVTSYYIGGSCGAALGGIAWNVGAWPACAAMVMTMLALIALVVVQAWARTDP